MRPIWSLDVKRKINFKQLNKRKTKWKNANPWSKIGQDVKGETNEQNERIAKTQNVRTECEYCGTQLETPETDIRNVAVCTPCLESQGIVIEEESDNVGDIVAEAEVNLGFEKPCITEEELARLWKEIRQP